MKKNMFGEQIDNIKLPKINFQLLKEKLKSIDFDKAFKVGVLLIGVVVIFQLNGIADKLDKGNRYTGYGLSEIVDQLQDIEKRLK